MRETIEIKSICIGRGVTPQITLYLNNDFLHYYVDDADETINFFCSKSAITAIKIQQKEGIDIWNITIYVTGTENINLWIGFAKEAQETANKISCWLFNKQKAEWLDTKKEVKN